MPEKQFRPATLFVHGLYDTLFQYLIYVADHAHNSKPQAISYTQTRSQFCTIGLMSPRRATEYFNWLEEIGVITILSAQDRLLIDRKACQEQLLLLKSTHGSLSKGVQKFDGNKLPEIRRQRLARKARKGEHPESPEAFKADEGK